MSDSMYGMEVGALPPPRSSSNEDVARFVRSLPMRERIIQLRNEERKKLRRWLDDPNGGLVLSGELTVEAVEGGFIWLRIQPPRAPQLKRHYLPFPDQSYWRMQLYMARRAKYCDAQVPEPPYRQWYCSRPAGHTGRHAVIADARGWNRVWS